MCCSRQFCGAFWGAVLLVVMAATFATPWYYVHTRSVGDDDKACKVTVLRGWIDQYCESRDCPKSTEAACPKHIKWREDDDSACAGGSDACSSSKKLYDTTAGLMAASLLFALLTSAGLFMRCCCIRTHHNKNHLLTLCIVLGVGFLVAALSHFASREPHAIADDDGAGLFNALLSCGADKKDGPCDRLWGKGPVLTAEMYWGGAGWAVGCLSLGLYLIALCFSCTNYARPHDGEEDERRHLVGHATDYQRYDAGAGTSSV